MGASSKATPHLRALSVLALAGLVCACSWTSVSDDSESTPLLTLPPVEQSDQSAAPATPSESATPGTDAGAAIAALAQRQLGVPYLYGGTSPKGFDCSGLVYYTYARAGIEVPRTSSAQFYAARKIPRRQARPGDLLFFVSRNNSHVAIYIGNHRFVHAPSTGKRVSTASMNNDYYRDRLVAVGRLTP